MLWWYYRRQSRVRRGHCVEGPTMWSVGGVYYPQNNNSLLFVDKVTLESMTLRDALCGSCPRQSVSMRCWSRCWSKILLAIILSPSAIRYWQQLAGALQLWSLTWWEVRMLWLVLQCQSFLIALFQLSSTVIYILSWTAGPVISLGITWD